MPVRTRFAPSPTGYMHIGGMRTALFNWLWARHNGGRFILRIDDTDRQRNVGEALEPILRAFRWLGLDWDEGPQVGGPFAPYFQSERNHLYREAADRLLAEGKAFRDFDPPELTKADREAAEKEKRPYLNIRRSLELTPEQIRQYEAEGRPSVLRFLVPREGKQAPIVLDDLIRGRVEWDSALMADPVIMRGDGTPLYNFATVVDDAHMQISHVIRAEEHLSNTPVQILIHRALGNELPQFAHIPYVAAPGSKEKLSKRKLDKYRNNPQFKRMFEAADRVFPQIGLGGSSQLDPVMVEYYDRIGYLPQAVLNALARLGWSLDDKTEIMSRQTLIQAFTLDRVVKGPAGFDPEKLDSFQAHWMGQLSLDEKIDGCLPYLLKAGMLHPESTKPDTRPETEPASVRPEPPQIDPATHANVARLITALGDRLRLFSDILDYPEFLVPCDQLQYDEKAFDKRVRAAGMTELLRKFREQLAAAQPFEAHALEEMMRRFVEAEGIKMGEIVHSVRVAVTGKSVGPGLFDCLELLGRERCLQRIDQALARV